MVTYGGIWINLKENYFFSNCPLPPLSLLLTVAHPLGVIYFSSQLFVSVKIKDGSYDFF